MARPTIRERIQQNVTVDGNGCWIWTKSLDKCGYGQLYTRETRLAHRIAYTAWRGDIPRGLQLDHLCRVRACVNPKHLEPVTSRVNILRGETLAAANAAKTHCAAGHPFDAANTHITRAGRRKCRTCNNRWRQESAVRARQVVAAA